jgi:uncharacterized protein YndB with AHSA1/START domain
MWSYEHTVDTAAPVGAVWQVYTDTAAWPEWNAGVGNLELEGTFTTGARGMLTPRGQEPLPFTVMAAEPGAGYTSETAIAETVVMRTTNVLEPLPHGGTRITQRLTMHGAAAEHFATSFGPAFAASVPSTLEALARRAQARNV